MFILSKENSQYNLDTLANILKHIQQDSLVIAHWAIFGPLRKQAPTHWIHQNIWLAIKISGYLVVLDVRPWLIRQNI